MDLGYMSAILPEKSLEEVLTIAAEIGYETVEVMCWPAGKAERRYAGITHIDVEGFSEANAKQVNDLVTKTGVKISALGYYPNPLTPNADERAQYTDHIKKVIDAAQLIGLDTVNTFVGRDPSKTVEDNWPMFLETWRPLVAHAEKRNVKIGIENCPMIFSYDEWPGGKNLAFCPKIWRKMFDDIPSKNFGLNYDPSHLIWLFIDPVAPIYEFADRFHHVHAKDVRVDYEKLQQVGVLNLDWHTPKLPGMGDVNWGKFFSALSDVGYNGPVCVEVEDRAYEGSFEDRKRSLIQSFRYLSQYVV